MNEHRGILDRLWLALVGFFRTAFVEGVTQGADELARGIGERTPGIASGEGKPVVLLTVAAGREHASPPSANDTTRSALPPAAPAATTELPHAASGLDDRLKASGPPALPPMAPPPAKRGRGRPPKS